MQNYHPTKRKLNNMSIKNGHIWFLYLLFLLLTFQSNGQDAYVVNYDVLVSQLEEALEKGNHRAFYEIGGLLDQKEIKEKLIDVLNEHTVFPKEQISFTKNLSRETYFDFLNQYENQIEYSPILRIYFTQSLSELETEHQLVRRRRLSEKEKSIEFKRWVNILGQQSVEEPSEIFIRHQLKQIAQLKTYESFDYLLGCLEKKNLPVNILKMDFISEAICDALSEIDDPSILPILLNEIEKGKIEDNKAILILSNITNVKFEENSSKKIVKKYQSTLDSLGALSEMRKYGFNLESTTRIEYFMDEVDYYGYMLSNYYMVPWLRKNAIREMVKTGNSRSLFHLAGVLYAQFNNDYFDTSIIEKELSELLDLSVLVQNESNTFVPINGKEKDETYYFNLVKYWAKYHQDYEYNSDARIFVNLKLEEENEESASRLFKKLTSENEKVALNSFQELSEFPHQIISRLNEKYQPILRRAHPKLPDFRYRFLENVALLNEFCEMENISVSLNKNLLSLLEELKKDNLSIKERYQIEDQIIKELSINDITGIEINGFIYSRNVAFNFSISRILDIYYSSVFDDILKNDNQVRLFLKKTALFSQIGIGGICNRYAQKIEKQKDKLKPKLIKLSEKEYDEDIRNAISYILANEDENEGFLITLKSFLQSPLSYEERDWSLIEAPKRNEIKSVFKKIKSTKEPERLNAYLNYLSYHADEKYSFYLIQLLTSSNVIAQKGEITRTVADDAVQMLENIYNFSFRRNENESPRESAKDWVSFSKKNKKNTEWSISFLSLKIEKLKKKEFVEIDQINEILLQRDLTDDLIEETLSLLPHLKMKNNVRKLEFQDKLPLTFLSYFESLTFSAKYLDDVIDFFQREDQEELLIFCNKFLNESKDILKGKYYNRICDVDGMLQTIKESDQKTRENIIDLLMNYLDDSEFISEFEERRVLQRVFVLKFGHLSIQEKLEKATTFIDDPLQVYNIQQNILNDINLDELAEVIKSYDYLTNHKNESALSFLDHNFGLPSYMFETQKKRDLLLKDIQQLEASAFYIHYLKKSGLELENSSGGIDYNKIRNTLEFDIVSPFSSSISKNRTHYALGVIKLLETKFPDHTINSSFDKDLRQKAFSWIQYLKEQGKLERGKLTTCSFNHTS